MIQFFQGVLNPASGTRHGETRFDLVAIRAISSPRRSTPAARRSAALGGLFKVLLLATLALIVVGIGQKLGDVCGQDSAVVCGP